jgi:hypothetical protein
MEDTTMKQIRVQASVCTKDAAEHPEVIKEQVYQKMLLALKEEYPVMFLPVEGTGVEVCEVTIYTLSKLEVKQIQRVLRGILSIAGGFLPEWEAINAMFNKK